jgi:hypothetical protein
VLTLAACVAPPAARQGRPEPPSETGAESQPATAGETARQPALPIAPEDLAMVDPGKALARTTPGARPGLRSLIGLGPRELTELLGAPRFRRRDGVAEIWQYAEGNCILDLFLYETDGVHRVRHAAFRGNSVRRVSERRCFAVLFDQPHK